MTPELRIFPAKTFVGKRLRMSFTSNRAFELWNVFMPQRRDIIGAKGDELYDIQIYPPGYFDRFNPSAEFEKWAAVEVSGTADVPPGMEHLKIYAGQYAVFIHRGPESKAQETFEHIFTSWLPSSGFEIDDRPHINVMGKNYSRHAEDSEEEIWIPVKPNTSVPI
jgi:AraC family transcriptional regulator